MSRIIIVFIILTLVVISLATLAYLSIISKDGAAMIIIPIVTGYAYHKFYGKKDKAMNIMKIMEGTEEKS